MKGDKICYYSVFMPSDVILKRKEEDNVPYDIWGKRSNYSNRWKSE